MILTKNLPVPYARIYNLVLTVTGKFINRKKEKKSSSSADIRCFLKMASQQMTMMIKDRRRRKKTAMMRIKMKRAQKMYTKQRKMNSDNDGHEQKDEEEFMLSR